ncbi:MAG: amino acid racemase [Eggerthellaceae bacterium]|nr:amino acid racemase [Eggerthellaceae bacterium]
MYDLGIIGGMGSKATVAAFDRIVDYTLATCDQEHINIIVLNDARIPERTASILKSQAGVAEALAKDFLILEQLKVPVAVTACNTSHYFIRRMLGGETPFSGRFIDTIEETANYLEETYPDRPICVLGTSGLILSDIFGQGKQRNNIIYPDQDSQKTIMGIIGAIKSGANIENEVLKTTRLLEALREKGNDTIFVLACTELSLLKDYLTPQFTCVDVLDITAICAILKSGYMINNKPEKYLANIEYFMRHVQKTETLPRRKHSFMNIAVSS